MPTKEWIELQLKLAGKLPFYPPLGNSCETRESGYNWYDLCFNLESIPDEDAERIKTVNDAVDYIYSRLKK